MSIKDLSPGRWLLDVRGWKDGKEHRRREWFKGARRTAQARHDTLKTELRASLASSLTTPALLSTFDACIPYYLERNPMPPGKGYQYLLDGLRNDLGPVSLTDLRSKFDSYYLLLRKTKSPFTGRLYSNQAINHRIKKAKAILNFCLRNGVISSNPLTFFRPLPTRPRDRLLTQEEQERLLAACAEVSPHLLPLVRYCLAVPCRRGELLGLRREAYDAFAGVIRVPGEATKNGRPVTKPVPQEQRSYFQSIPPACPWLFYRVENGQYLPLGDFRKSWHHALELAKIESFTFHDTRHCAYSSLILAGNPLPLVMKASGHQTDMSATYFSVASEQAAKLIKFPENPAQTGHKPDTFTVSAVAS